MLEKIREILLKYSAVSKDEITENAVLTADLGLSSFDVVSITADFEDEFDIEIPDRDIRRFVKVEDIIEYLKSKQDI